MRWLVENRGLRAGGLLLLTMALCPMALPAMQKDKPGNVPRKRKEVYKTQVEQLEKNWRTAQLASDVAALEKLLSDDYIGITMTGQVVTKTQQLDRIRDRQLVLTRMDLDEVKVHLIGSTAVVTSLAKIDGTNEGSAVHGTFRYTRVYSRLPSGSWKITNFEATRVGEPAAPINIGKLKEKSPN